MKDNKLFSHEDAFCGGVVPFGVNRQNHQVASIPKTKKMIRTILADDHRIFVEGLKTVLSEAPDLQFQIVDVAFNGEQLLRQLREYQIDLVILDLNLPRKDGIELALWVRREKIPVRLLALTSYNEQRIVKSALKAGIDGYILKNNNIGELFTAVRELLAGHSYLGEGVGLNEVRNGQRKRQFEDRFLKKHRLTKREAEILHLIAEALSNKQIAKQLFISDQTVSVHRKNIMRKLGVSSTAGLIKMAYEQNLV